MSKSCIFCDIIEKKETNANILYEVWHWVFIFDLNEIFIYQLIVWKDNDILIIFDKFPVSKTHFLVLPKLHIVTARDLKVEHVPLGIFFCYHSIYIFSSKMTNFSKVEKMVEKGNKVFVEKFNGDVNDMRWTFFCY